MYVVPELAEDVKTWINEDIGKGKHRYCIKWEHPSVKFVCDGGKFRAPFRQMHEWRIKKRGDTEWILFSQDDGIWHPKRVEFFKTHIKTVQMEHNIIAVTCGSVTSMLPESKNTINSISCVADVDDAIKNNTIKIEQWDSPDHEIEEGTRQFNLELPDMCVRSWVFHKFLDTYTKYCDNLYVDVEFCEFCDTLPYYQTYKVKSPHWLFFTRCVPPKAYKYLDNIQVSNTMHTIPNSFHMVPMMERLAQMDELPTLKHTAKVMIDGNLLSRFPHHERVMLVAAFQKASADREWVSLKYLPFNL